LEEENISSSGLMVENGYQVHLLLHVDIESMVWFNKTSFSLHLSPAIYFIDCHLSISYLNKQTNMVASIFCFIGVQYFPKKKPTTQQKKQTGSLVQPPRSHRKTPHRKGPTSPNPVVLDTSVQVSWTGRFRVSHVFHLFKVMSSTSDPFIPDRWVGHQQPLKAIPKKVIKNFCVFCVYVADVCSDFQKNLKVTPDLNFGDASPTRFHC